MTTHLDPRDRFARLPILLTYSDLVDLGIPERSIPHLVAAGRLTYVRLRPNARRRYHKLSVGRLLGFIAEHTEGRPA